MRWQTFNTKGRGGTNVRSSVLVQNKLHLLDVVYFPLKYRSVSVGLESTDGLTEQMKILRHGRTQTVLLLLLT